MKEVYSQIKELLSSSEIDSVFIDCGTNERANEIRVAVSMYRLRHDLDYFFTEVNGSEVRLCKYKGEYGNVSDICLEAI